MKRVLVGDFGAIATLGIHELLEGECVFVADGTAEKDIHVRVRETAAEVVIIDSDSPQAAAIAQTLSRFHPGVTVIGCSLTEPTFVVFTGPGASYTAALEPSSLLEAVNGS